MAIYRVEPIVDKTLWGSNQLNILRGNGDVVGGTSWEISFHPYGSNKILNSEFTLADELNMDVQKMIGNTNPKKVLRLAYLDTKDRLSVQLHPTIEYANTHHIGDYGKYEAWYIIDAQPGAKLAAGINLKTVEELMDSIKNNRLEKDLIYHDVKAGDFIYIPAGTIHALGANILAIEVSTNSNTTYRVYDYGRVDSEGKSRALHLQQVIDNVDFESYPQIVSLDFSQPNSCQMATDNEHFIVNVVDVEGEYCLKIDHQPYYVTVLSHEMMANQEKLNYLENIFISSESNDVVFNGKGRLLVSRSK